MAITKIEKVASGNIEFRDAGDNLRASLTSSAFARPVGMQGVEVEDATGSKIQVFATVVTEMISDAGTVNNPTQQQLLEELATNFF